LFVRTDSLLVAALCPLTGQLVGIGHFVPTTVESVNVV